MDYYQFLMVIGCVGRVHWEFGHRVFYAPKLGVQWRARSKYWSDIVSSYKVFQVLKCRNSMVPTRTGKLRKLFPVREMSGNFEQTGKLREFHSKYWKNEEILASFYLYFFCDFLIEVYLLNRVLYFINSWNKMLKKYWKIERKYWKSHGNLSVRKCGNHEFSQ